MKYIPLSIKTEYDLMNSLIKIDELVSYAKENGFNTLGITDENMFGAYEFLTLCNKKILLYSYKISNINFLKIPKIYKTHFLNYKTIIKTN